MPGSEDDPLVRDVARLLLRNPSVTGVRLVGSRAEGRATPFSDWDFSVATADFSALAPELPDLVRPLEPLARFWDPLSRHRNFILVLRGPRKVDLLFDESHRPEPPWVPTRDSLPRMDDHFWDWILWISAKQRAGRRDLVATEFAKLHRHLLAPLGASEAPETVAGAVDAYLRARSGAEERLGVRVRRVLQSEVMPVLDVEPRETSLGAIRDDEARGRRSG